MKSLLFLASLGCASLLVLGAISGCEKTSPGSGDSRLDIIQSENLPGDDTRKRALYLHKLPLSSLPLAEEATEEPYACAYLIETEKAEFEKPLDFLVNAFTEAQQIADEEKRGPIGFTESGPVPKREPVYRVTPLHIDQSENLHLGFTESELFAGFVVAIAKSKFEAASQKWKLVKQLVRAGLGLFNNARTLVFKATPEEIEEIRRKGRELQVEVLETGEACVAPLVVMQAGKLADQEFNTKARDAVYLRSYLDYSAFKALEMGIEEIIEGPDTKKFAQCPTDYGEIVKKISRKRLGGKPC